MVATMTVCLSLFAREKDRWDDEAQRRKAEYIYGEAQRQNALGNSAATYQLYQRAYELDSANTDYYSELALNYLMMAKRDESLVTKAIDLLGKKFDTDPTDYTNAYYYSQVMGSTGNSDRQIEVLQVIDSLNPARADLAVTYIDALLATQDTANMLKAIDRLDRLEVTAGRNMNFTRRKAAIYSFLNDSVNALNEIRGAIAYSPLNPECYSFAGRYFELDGKPDSALVYYQRACEIDPESGEAAFSLAQFYKNSGDTLGYSREIDRVLTETDLDIDDKHEILLNYTRDLLGDSTYRHHVDAIFNRVIEKNPQEASIRSLFAEYLVANNEYIPAAEQMEYVVDMQPDDSDNWIRTAVFYNYAEDYPKAVSALERSLRYHDNSKDVHALLGATLYIESPDNVDRAISETLRAIELTDSTDTRLISDYLSRIGDYYYAEELTDSSEIYYTRAIEMYPDNIMAKNNLAYHISEHADDTDSLARAESLSYDAVTSEPDNPVYLDTYAWILFRQQDYKRAKEYMDRTLSHMEEKEMEPGPEYYIHAGDIYFWNQLPDDALKFWEKALELAPDNELLARKVKYKTYFHE